MNLEKAKSIAEKIIDKRFENASEPVLLSDRETREFSRGWIFRYNTKEFIETWDIQFSLMKVIPIVVDKIDGKVYRLFDPNLSYSNPLLLLEDYIYRKENENEEINTESEIDYELQEYEFNKIPYISQIPIKLGSKDFKRQGEDSVPCPLVCSLIKRNKE